MALHTELPIYKPTLNLLRGLTEATKHMPRDFKGTVGKDLRSDAARLVRLIYKANSVRNRAKVPFLSELLEDLQMLELQLRVSLDMRLISPKQYSDAIGRTQDIGRQANGWRNKSAASPVA